MSFEKYLRQKQIEKEATEAASKSVNEVLSSSYVRSEFEKLHEISEILDRNGGGYYRELTKDYHHNYPYFEKFLNGAWSMYQHQQSKLDDLQLLYMQQGVNMFKLQKRLDAALEVVKQGIRKQGIGKQCGDYYLEKVEELLEGGGC